MSTHALSKEVAAANALKEALALETDDAEAIRDTIEGETNLHEAIAAVMAEIREDEMMATGIGVMIESLETRKKRLSDRIVFRRAAIERAMLIGEISSLTLPDATISLKRVPPKLEITDEARIPAKFWKPQDPKLDKAALKEALEDGEDVSGASLGNGGISLSVRRK